MRFFKWLFLLFLLLLDLVIAIFLVMFGLGIISMDTVLTILTDVHAHKYSSIWITGAGLLLFIFVLSVIFIRKKRPVEKDKFISFDNPEGKILVSISAIEDFIGKIGKRFSQIKDLYPVVVPVSNGINLKIKIILWSGEHIPAIAEEFQKELKSQIQDVLGIKDIQKVDLTISQLAEKKGAATATRLQREEASQDEEKVPNIPYR